jgi:hypothetical protein
VGFDDVSGIVIVEIIRIEKSILLFITLRAMATQWELCTWIGKRMDEASNAGLFLMHLAYLELC